MTRVQWDKSASRLERQSHEGRINRVEYYRRMGSLYARLSKEGWEE